MGDDASEGRDKKMSQINRITIHPINTALLDKLRINHSSKVTNARVGSVIARLVKAGYTNVSVYAEKNTDSGLTTIYYHCKKGE